MIVDRHTLSDLGVIPDGPEPSMLALFGGTWTPPGRVRLRELLTTPLSSAQAIRERQQALRELLPALPDLANPTWAALVVAVRDYLDSRFVPMPAGKLQNWRVRLLYPGVTSQLGTGVRATADLILLASHVGARLRQLQPHAPDLAKIAAALERPSVDPALQRILPLPDRRDSSYDVTRHDAALRGACRDAVEDLLAAARELDALQAMAATVQRPGWSLPDIADGAASTLSFEGLRHPLLPDGVDNDLQLGEHRLLFLTGPNMAGKTTLLKAVGLAVHLAHCGMPVPARAATIPVFDRLHAALTVRDSVVRGESYFLAEVRRVAGLVEPVAAGERVLALLDEMFKGTNVLDASDATALVCAGLASSPAGCFLVASHLSELAGVLSELPAIGMKQMEVMAGARGPEATYRVRDGVSRQRLGMRLLEREGVVNTLARLRAGGRSGEREETAANR